MFDNGFAFLCNVYQLRNDGSGFVVFESESRCDVGVRVWKIVLEVWWGLVILRGVEASQTFQFLISQWRHKAMGRLKRTSKILDRANARAAGLRSIGALDFGNGLTSASYEQAIADAQAKLDDYNQTLSSLDEKANNLAAAEKTLQDFSERFLAGVAARFGKDSSEYEKAGGVRKSERKRPASRKSEKTTVPA